MNIYALGSTNLDLYIRPQLALKEADSNPAKIETMLGGVAYNVASNLKAMGIAVRLVCALGDDQLSLLIRQQLARQGFDPTFLLFKPQACAPLYCAVLADNDLKIAYADTSINEELSFSDLKPLLTMLKADDYLFCDTNLNEKTLVSFLKACPCHKYVDGVSQHKVLRIKEALSSIAVLKVNVKEAEVLSGFNLQKEGIVAIYRKLLATGLKELIVSAKEGVYLNIEQELFFYRCTQKKFLIKNTSGAGDALIAQYLYQRSIDVPKDEAIRKALTAAILKIGGQEINATTLETTRRKLRIERGGIGCI